MTRWASYYDLLEVDKKILDKCLDTTSLYCFQASNLSFEYSSSTGGMYPSWRVAISANCTVNNLMLGLPIGCGGHINDALEDLTNKLLDLPAKHKELAQLAYEKGFTKNKQGKWIPPARN